MGHGRRKAASHPPQKHRRPASAWPTWVKNLIEYCENGSIPLDFVSTHACEHRPQPSSCCGVPAMHPQASLRFLALLTVAECAADPTMYLSHRAADIANQRYQLQLARNLSNTNPDIPLLITEWSSSPSSRAPYHDTWQKAAFVVAAVLDAIDTPGLNLTAYSFWALSDIFTEGGFPSHGIPFHGGFGLLNVFGVRKPAFRAFELLHKGGSMRAAVEVGPGVGSGNLTVLPLLNHENRTLTVLVANHACPSCGVLGNATIDLHVSGISLAGGGGDHVTTITAMLGRVNSTSANPQAAWVAMGSPDYPTPSQLQVMHEASAIVEDPVSLRKADDIDRDFIVQRAQANRDSALRGDEGEGEGEGLEAWVLSGLVVEAYSLVYVRIEY